jgi:hypothetical protein
MQHHLFKGLHIQNYKSFVFSLLINLFKCSTVQEQIFRFKRSVNKKECQATRSIKVCFSSKTGCHGLILQQPDAFAHFSASLMILLISQQT